MQKRDTYWCVQVALAVHSQIEFGLHPLDSHHSQAHWNKVEHGCKAETKSIQLNQQIHKEMLFFISWTPKLKPTVYCFYQSITGFKWLSSYFWYWKKDVHDEGVLCLTDITPSLSYGTVYVHSSAADAALTKRTLALNHTDEPGCKQQAESWGAESQQ